MPIKFIDSSSPKFPIKFYFVFSTSTTKNLKKETKTQTKGKEKNNKNTKEILKNTINHLKLKLKIVVHAFRKYYWGMGIVS